MRHYEICGLHVASELTLAGASAAEAGAAEVTIRVGDVADRLDGAGEDHATYMISGGRLLLRIPGVARFLIDGAQAVLVAPAPGAAARDAEPFLLGTVFGLLMQLRGEVVLHAGAVRLGDAAVLLMGPSGAGKSTLLAALAERGLPVLGDNLCRISVEGGIPVAHPDAARVQLWSQGFERLGLAALRGDPVRAGIEKYFAATPVEAAALPLAGAYALRETRPPARDGVTRPNVVDQTMLVGRCAFRQRPIEWLGARQHYLNAAAAIAGRSGVFLYDRPIDFAALAQSIDVLIAHWRERGLMGASP